MAKLVVGCGYLGERVASRWLRGGDDVYAVTRSVARAQAFESLGLRPIVADVTDRATLSILPPVDTVLYAVGYDRSSQQSMREVYVSGLAVLLDSLPDRVQRLMYISSTSVYGQKGGEWINEDSACEPVTENGRICLAAEEVIAQHPLGPRACVLRLAGIYGPGRIPRRELLEAGEPISTEPGAHLNLIHVDDAAQVVDAVARLPAPARRYLVADGRPVIRREFYRELARLLNAPEPKFAASAATDPAPTRGTTDKRISSRRMLDDLRIDLTYPSYREGLAAIVSAD